MTKDKLVLGAAGKGHPDAVTLDVSTRHKPDVVHDLDVFPWPFEDGRFGEIVCHHVIEHLSGLTPALRELHRICRPGGRITIEVPHFSSWMANDPEHKMRFSYFALDPYFLGHRKNWLLVDFSFDLLERRLTFHRAFRRYFFHRLWNRCPLAYERFWTYLMPAEHLIFVLSPVKT
ncbi:MAG: class I SAM-dependent methyltransferase [Deltaproteobacteria bacterium]